MITRSLTKQSFVCAKPYTQDEDYDQDDPSYDEASIDIKEFLDSDDDYDKPLRKPRNTTKRSNSVAKTSGRKAKKKRRPKPHDMPRRPLSAYNLFFQEQRALIIGTPAVHTTKDHTRGSKPAADTGYASFERKKRAHRKTHGKISFSDLAKKIGTTWNTLNSQEKAKYEAGAAKEKTRYQEELRLYRQKTKVKGDAIQQNDDGNDDALSSTSNWGGESPDSEQHSPVSTMVNLYSDSNRRGGSIHCINHTHRVKRSHLNADEVTDYNAPMDHMCIPKDNAWELTYDSSNIHSFDAFDLSTMRTSRKYGKKHRTIHVQDEHDIHPLPVSYTADDAINVREMAEFVKPLLTAGMERKKKYVPVENHMQTDVYSYHQSPHAKEPVDKFYPICKDHMDESSTSQPEMLHNIQETPVGTQRSSICLSPRCLVTVEGRKKKTSRFSDHEVADFLSFLLTDHCDSQQDLEQCNSVPLQYPQHKHQTDAKHHRESDTVIEVGNDTLYEHNLFAV